ncbi:hypothetical protein BST61_g4273 [Cercospora zeina]
MDARLCTVCSCQGLDLMPRLSLELVRNSSHPAPSKDTFRHLVCAIQHGSEFSQHAVFTACHSLQRLGELLSIYSFIDAVQSVVVIDNIIASLNSLSAANGCFDTIDPLNTQIELPQSLGAIETGVPGSQTPLQNLKNGKVWCDLEAQHPKSLPPMISHYALTQQRKFANPAPLGLGAFALTTFVLSCINLKVLDITAPNLVIALAYAYGGLIQLLAGMWEIACGNTFGATALSSYGGFWLSFGILLTPSFGIVESYQTQTQTAAGGSGTTNTFHDAFALYLWAWFIFTTLCLLVTTRSNLAFFFLFFVLDLAFLCLALGEQYALTSAAEGLHKAGGVFGVLAAFAAWWNMFAGMADQENFWLEVPVGRLPWSGKERRRGEKGDIGEKLV